MKRLKATIDRWGPAFVAVLTFVAMAGLAWIYDSRLAYQAGLIVGLQREIDGLERQFTRKDQVSADLREEMRLWQAYVISLQKKLLESGIPVPESPNPKQKEE